MSEQKSYNVDKILKGSENFFIWYDYVIWLIRKEALSDYVSYDKIKDIDVDHPTNVEEIAHVMNNGRARTILIDTITNQIHKEVIGIDSACTIMEKLKKKYDGDDTDISYWVKSLNSLSTQEESEIMDTLETMKGIFEAMQKKNLNLSNNEKIKYIYSSIPRSYMSKYVLEVNETFDTVTKSSVSKIITMV